MYSAREGAERYFRRRWSRSRGAWGVVENYSTAIKQACQEDVERVQLHTQHSDHHRHSAGELDTDAARKRGSTPLGNTTMDDGGAAELTIATPSPVGPMIGCPACVLPPFFG
jgi:hypothetical protein